jgi:hypothetical protein
MSARSRVKGQGYLDASAEMTEAVVKDLKADWRKWTRVEKISLVFIAFGMSSMVPTLLLLSQG